MRDIWSIEAWARVSSDAIKELKALWFNLPEMNALLFFIQVRLLQEKREMSMCLLQEIRITWYSNVTNNIRTVPSYKALHAKCNNSVFTMQSVIVASSTSRTKTLLQFIRSGDYVWWCWSLSLSHINNIILKWIFFILKNKLHLYKTIYIYIYIYIYELE
jgi:hypothetical protein